MNVCVRPKRTKNEKQHERKNLYPLTFINRNEKMPGIRRQMEKKIKIKK